MQDVIIALQTHLLTVAAVIAPIMEEAEAAE